ncbi:MAG: hypothetical protein JST20_11420 [Bacteroidetes bacterium]|nr:hypothetical protein [Bacteroidota bacterium]
MDSKSENSTEILTVDFYEVDAGWLFFTLRVGQQTFEGRFSDIYDPILDLRVWLEAISEGVQQTSFIYNLGWQVLLYF